MVEQAMFFLVGFLVAGLIALLFLPVLARRAMRLSEARARLMAPLSQQQAMAERDQLRAEHAVDRLRLEQRMAALEDSVAVHRADLGRQATKIARLEDVSAERLAEITAQRDELARKGEEIRSLDADLGSSRVALDDFGAQIERARAEIIALSHRRIELETAADKNRTVIAGLETRVSGLEIELEDSRRGAQGAGWGARTEQTRLSQALAAQQEENRRVNASMTDAMAKGAALIAEIETNARQLREARARLSETEALLARSERAREDALIESSRLLSRIAERDRSIEDIEARAQEREARLTQPIRAARADEEAAAMGVLRGERASMQREIDDLRERLAAGDSPPEGDAELRQAISRLAHDVVRLTATTAGETAAPSNLLNFELREPSFPFELGDDAAKGSTVVKLRQMPPRAPER